MTRLRRVAILLAAAIGLLAVALPATADPSSTGVKVSTVHTQPGSVTLLVSTSAGGQLNPQSVVVKVGDRTLESTARIPSGAGGGTAAAEPIREVYLVLDTSGSMAGDGIGAARAAARDYAQSLPADVRVGLVTFSDTPHLLLSATTDRSALYAAVAHVQAGGNTSLYDAIQLAVTAMKGLPSNAVRRLLILSDGADNTSHSTESSAQSALRIVDVSADVVAFRLPGNEKVLEQLATASGGKVLPVGDAGHLAAAFAQAAQVFKQQLEVTVSVPADLANTSQTLTISANSGSATITATTTLTLPAAVAASAPPPATTAATTAAAAPVIASTELWIVVGLAFVAILAVALTLLFLPVMAAARAERSARLAEMHRYRVVGAVGSTGAEVPPVVSPTAGTTAVTQRTLSFVDRTMRARGNMREQVVNKLEGAGLRMRPEEWAVLQAAIVVGVGALLGFLAANFFAAVLGGALAYAGCRLFLRIRTTRREAAFLTQLPDTLQLIAGSLRSGFSLSQALNTVVREGTEPSASEFTRALTEARLGAEIEDALDDVAARMKCDDLAWVVMAVRISREVGGNLAEVLGNTVATMRQRAELRGLVRVLSAEGRISAKILMALPFVLAGFLLFFRRPYITPLVTSATGWAMIAAGLVLLTVGGFWLSRLVKIEV